MYCYTHLSLELRTKVDDVVLVQMEEPMSVMSIQGAAVSSSNTETGEVSRCRCHILNLILPKYNTENKIYSLHLHSMPLPICLTVFLLRLSVLSIYIYLSLF